MDAPSKEFFDSIQERYGNPEVFVEITLGRITSLGLNQIDVAERAGVDYHNMNRWLSGKREPTMWSMVLVDEALCRIEQETLDALEESE